MYSTFSDTSPHTLPANVHRPEQNFLRFTAESPPCVPQVRIEEWMYPYVRPVAAMSAAVIQAEAQKSHLRMFFFNLYAQNNFNNEKFAALVNGILDYIVFMLAREPGMRMEALVEEAVAEIIALMTAAMVNHYPALRAYVTADLAPDVEDHIQGFARITAAVDAFRRQHGYLPHPPGQGWRERSAYDAMGGGPSWSGGGPSFPGAMYPETGRHSMISGLPGRHDGVLEASAQVFNGGQAPQMAPQRSGEIYSSRFSNTPDPIVPRWTSAAPYAHVNGSTSQGTTTMHAACEPKKVQQDGPLEAADDTSLDWYPSADQRYHPVYNPDTQALFYQRLASEAVFAVVKARVHHMDYDRHLTKSVFGPVPPSLDLSRRERVEDRLRLGLSQIEEERQARKEDETTGLSTRVREKMVEDVSLAGIWMQGAVEWQAATEHEERPGIYRLYASIHDFAVSEADESGFVETLRNAGTFRHLRTALDDQYGEVSPMLWHKANDRATKLVNRVLSLNLGLRDCTIDSFTEDFEPMLEALRKMHGEAMVDAFLRHQRTLISAIYRESPEDCREYITSDMCESLPDDAEKPEFTFMSSWSSLTFVNCVSHELGVEWGRGTTAIVTKHAVPLFYQIVKDIMSEARFLAYNLEHSLIQTLDGKIIEIGTAFLADDEGYVVRLVKCM